MSNNWEGGYSIASLGQDHHRFEDADTSKALLLAGVSIPGARALAGNSDADVVLHAITNAISGVTGRNILGAVADKLCCEGQKDSRAYLDLALADLREKDMRLLHLSLSIEALKPKLSPWIPQMKEQLSAYLGLPVDAIGLTATTGEGLTGMGQGEGIACLAILTVWKAFG